MITRIKALLTETEEKARMENELLAAQSVQKQFFPDTNPVLPALELQCATVPASECGGDLFYFHHFEKQVCFVFGDVTGHGLPAALSTAYIYGCLNTALGKMSQLSPEAGAAMFLNHLTQDLQSLMTSLRGDSAWLSALIGHLDLSTGKLTLKFHAHPSAFVLKADGAGLTTLSGVPSHPIGFEADPIEDVVEITLQADDQLILLSDGIYERSFTSGHSPTKRDWKKWLTHLPTDHSAASTLAAIRAKVSGDFGEKLADDITLVCLKYQPGSLTPVHPESPELKSKREGSV
jgi:sigma-B regulation protein RsbU (phosphoserine phosphatase)